MWKTVAQHPLAVLRSSALTQHPKREVPVNGGHKVWIHLLGHDYSRRGRRIRHLFAKLAALVMDMPWVKEANLNLLEFMKQVDPDGQNVLPELRAEIEERIQENGWTAQGMHRMEL